MVTNFCCAMAGAASDVSGNQRRSRQGHCSSISCAVLRLLIVACSCEWRLQSRAAAIQSSRSTAASTASPSRSTIVSIAPLVDDERRRQQHVVAARAVDRAAHRIDHQAARHRLALDPRVQLAFADRTAPWCRDRRPARRPGTGRGRAHRRRRDDCRTAPAAAAPDARPAGAHWRADRRGESRCCTASAAAQASGWPI